jgi:hypothetical protein
MSVIVTPDFFRRAADMRSQFNALVGPERSALPRRFCWDYWYVPGQFAYIRTFARNCFSAELYSEFARALRSWAQQNLGCYSWTEPWVSYYIDGCRQQFHSDVIHGPWAWVFSLTHWERRRFSGGETVLIAPRILDYWRNFNPGRPFEVDEILCRIPAKFNQLIVFDGRLPHAVAPVEGTSDPLDSRVVLHGWFLRPVSRAEGALAFNEVEPVLASITEKWNHWQKDWGRLNGVMTIRIQVEPSGTTGSVEVIASTLVSLDGDGRVPQQAREQALELASSSRYRTSSGATWITIPFIAADL